MTDYTLEVYHGGGPFSRGEYAVEAYGAVGDGTTDDSTSIQACIDAVVAAGAGTVKFTPGTDYYVGTGLVVDRGAATWMPVMVLDAYGATITAPTSLSDAIITLGVDGETQNNIHIRGGQWEYNGFGYTDTNNACIRLHNASYCRLYDVECLYGYEGIRVDSENGTTGWSAYNSSDNARIRSCLHGIHLDCEVNDSWVNENLFTGGRIDYASTLPDYTDGFAISLTVAGTPTQIMNNNKFVDVTCECGMPDFAITGITLDAADTVVDTVAGDIATYPTTAILVGDTIYFTGIVGTTEMNGNTYVVSAVDATTVTVTVNSSGFTPWSSAGTVSRRPRLVYDEYGAWNSFVRLRAEGFDSPLVQLGTNTKWDFWDSAITNFTDQDIDDLVAPADRVKIIARMALEQSLPGGQASVPVFRAFNTTGAGEPAIAVAGTTGITDVIRLYGNGSAWFTPMAGTPSEEIAGKFFFDNGTKKFKFYNGTAWETVTSAVV